jgi:protein gp37
MSDKSKIEWTDATWNPVTGCTKISPGCTHCYAETFSERFRGVPGHPFEQGFDLRLWPNRLNLPLLWKEPRRIFVNSMSDLFHERVPDAFIRDVFDVMARADQHVFQVLTKRSERLKEWTRLNVSRYGARRLPKNIWLGVSVENQAYVDRIRHLQGAPARIRFLSIEPLLGPINLPQSALRGIHWVIVGGESGPRARPMAPEWARTIRTQCEKSSNTAFFFKQWGAHNEQGERVGKGAAGRNLDGQTWDEMPRLQEA